MDSLGVWTIQPTGTNQNYYGMRIATDWSERSKYPWLGGFVLPGQPLAQQLVYTDFTSSSKVFSSVCFVPVGDVSYMREMGTDSKWLFGFGALYGGISNHYTSGTVDTAVIKVVVRMVYESGEIVDVELGSYDHDTIHTTPSVDGVLVSLLEDDILDGVFLRVEIVGQASNVGGNAYGWFCLTDFHIGEKNDEKENAGLLSSIIEFLQSIWDAIVGLPDAIGAFISALGDKLDSVFQFLVTLPGAILDGLKALFVPEDGDLQSLFDQFKAGMESHLGFVLQIDDLVSSVISPIVESGDNGDVILALPSVTLPPAFGGRKLWDETALNLSQLVDSNSAIKMIYGFYRVLASVLLLGLLLRYLYHVAADVLGERETSSGGGAE
jgi:hypothetical protein